MKSLESGFLLYLLHDNQESNTTNTNNNKEENKQRGIQLNALDYMDRSDDEKKERIFLLDSDEYKFYPCCPSINSKTNFLKMV